MRTSGTVWKKTVLDKHFLIQKYFQTIRVKWIRKFINLFDGKKTLLEVLTITQQMCTPENGSHFFILRLFSKTKKHFLVW